MPTRTMTAAVALMAIAGIGCSHDVTSPHEGLLITTIAGGGQRDTIGTTLNQALVLQVRSTSRIAGRTVRLTVSVPQATVQANGSSCFIIFTPLSGGLGNCAYTAATDSLGQVAVVLTFSTIATPASVIGTVIDSTGTAAGSPDTVHFTIDPGNATGVTAAPSDTAMFVSAMLGLRAYVHDRVGNQRTDAVTYGPASGPVTLSGKQVSATAIGRATIPVQSGAYADTTHISVVPQGMMAYGSSDPNHTGVAILALDGSSYRFVPTTGGESLHTSWAPNGKLIAFDHNDPHEELYSLRIAIVDTAGTMNQADTTSFKYDEVETYPQYSRDGQWLYFTRFDNINTVSYSAIWRVGANGAAAPVANQSPAWDYSASPSPDGSTLVYASTTGLDAPATLKVLNVATGAVTNLGVAGDSPRWAPQGQSIAFVTGGTPYYAAGALNVMQSDGSNAHGVGPIANTYEFGVDWSPDGQWLVAVNAVTGHVELVNVASGLALPLAFTSQVSSPTWRPTQ